MVAEQINQIVDMVAEKLGVAVEAVYPMLIKQADVFRSTYCVGLWILGISFILVVLFLVLIVIFGDDCSELTMCFLVGGLFVAAMVCFIAGINALVDLNKYFTAIHNPEWWAIEYVTKLVK